MIRGNCGSPPVRNEPAILTQIVAAADSCLCGELLCELPTVFCWSKFGTEAGEGAEFILSRKESERVQSDGVFLWGIGNSIAPSLHEILSLTRTPAVMFTPMLSRPAARDIRPPAIAQWNSATGLDGSSFDLPPHSLVTSSANLNGSNQKHYALVCKSDFPLTVPRHNRWIDNAKLRNLLSGARVGSSQVTSVVKLVDRSPPPRPCYQVAFDAVLTPPYLVTLSDAVFK